MLCTCHVLAGDNQNTIQKCMNSVVKPGLFHEVIVLVDTRSRDHTMPILLAYTKHYSNVKVYRYGWETPANFAKVRNDGIGITETPYAMWVDSDEELRKPEQIRGMLSRAKGQAFKMWVISPVQDGKFHNMYQPRLFPVRPGVHFECPVFERLDWSLDRCGVPIDNTSDDPIWHPGYTSAKGLESKNKRNIKIMKKYLRLHKTQDQQRAHIQAQYDSLR